MDARGGREPVIAARATSPDEVPEAVASGLGVALLAEGNVDLYRRPGIVCLPVAELAPAELAAARLPSAAPGDEVADRSAGFGSCVAAR
jgi:DNA-binding transcriptional LysR family regulator